jgi:hypothetical protein
VARRTRTTRHCRDNLDLDWRNSGVRRRMPSAVARAACVLGLRSSSDLSSGHRPSTSSTPARHNRHYHGDQHRLLRYRGCRQRKFELAPACTRLRIHRSRRFIDHRLVLPRPARTWRRCPWRRRRPQSWLVELASRGRWYGWSLSPSGNRRSHHQGAQPRDQIDTDGASADRGMDRRRSIRSCLSAPPTGAQMSTTVRVLSNGAAGETS